MTDTTYACKHYKTHLASSNHLISQNFGGKHANAVMFHIVANVIESASTERTMTTGRYVVRDFTCKNCRGDVLGWRFEKAYDANQRYKEGKWVLEMALVSII